MPKKPFLQGKRLFKSDEDRAWERSVEINRKVQGGRKNIGKALEELGDLKGKHPGMSSESED